MLEVGPYLDEAEDGFVFYVAWLNPGDGWDPVAEGEWRGEFARLTSLGAWFRHVKRHMKLPAPVGSAGLRWADAQIEAREPEENGSARLGITLTWTLR
mgnify:CR=1 FL=1